MKVKTGDMVRVLAGRDKGKEGKVTQVFPARDLVVVEGLNTRVKHLKRRGKEPGQRITFSGPLHASNVAVVGKSGVRGRVRYRVTGAGVEAKKTRMLKTKKGLEELD